MIVVTELVSLGLTNFSVHQLLLDSLKEIFLEGSFGFDLSLFEFSFQMWSSCLLYAFLSGRIRMASLNSSVFQVDLPTEPTMSAEPNWRWRGSRSNETFRKRNSSALMFNDGFYLPFVFTRRLQKGLFLFLFFSFLFFCFLLFSSFDLTIFFSLVLFFSFFFFLFSFFFFFSEPSWNETNGCGNAQLLFWPNESLRNRQTPDSIFFRLQF